MERFKNNEGYDRKEERKHDELADSVNMLKKDINREKDNLRRYVKIILPIELIRI
jgi:hypothetical protein